MTINYILKNNKPVVEPDSHKWYEWMDSDERSDNGLSILIRKGRINIYIKTEFRGFSSGEKKYMRNGKPLLFFIDVSSDYETIGKLRDMLSLGSNEKRCEGFRYALYSWNEAQRKHQKIVRTTMKLLKTIGIKIIE